jgi:hypothetical protein
MKRCAPAGGINQGGDYATVGWELLTPAIRLRSVTAARHSTNLPSPIPVFGAIEVRGGYGGVVRVEAVGCSGLGPLGCVV